MLIPRELKTLPGHYRQPCPQPGRLEAFVYQTYEAFSYGSMRAIPLEKEAIVYVPYGYDEQKAYNIVYLSHGGWSNQRTLMGGPDEPHAFKHIIDHAIMEGELEPLLIVCLTYNNLTDQDSSDYGLAIELTERYHQELIHDLIPAIEGHYRTYAASTAPEDLIASRHHRAFSGFSMGAVNTWCAFQYALDYFYYFNPMSGNVGNPTSLFVQAAEKWPQDFFIFALSGTQDFAYQAFKAQVSRMAREAPQVFRWGDDDQVATLTFRERLGARHDYAALCDLTYNALTAFWPPTLGG